MSFATSVVTASRLFLFAAPVALAVACGGGNGSDGAGGDGGTSGPSGPSGPTSDPIVGKSCNSDGDCGSGYTCDGAKPGGPTACTPDRACTADECKGICLGMGQFDPMTGEPTKACLDDCASTAKCCSGPGPTSPGTAGKCAKAAGPSPTPTSDAGPSPTDGGPTTTPMNWDGTWTIDVEYDVSCDYGFGNVKKGHQKQTLTMSVDGPSSSLTVTPQTPTSGWNPMTGTGSDSGMTVSGPFPFRDNGGEFASSGDNALTLRITSVASSKSASGSLDGDGKNSFGAKCTVSAGTASISR